MDFYEFCILIDEALGGKPEPKTGFESSTDSKQRMRDAIERMKNLRKEAPSSTITVKTPEQARDATFRLKRPVANRPGAVAYNPDEDYASSLPYEQRRSKPRAYAVNKDNLSPEEAELADGIPLNAPVEKQVSPIAQKILDNLGVLAGRYTSRATLIHQINALVPGKPEELDNALSEIIEKLPKKFEYDPRSPQGPIHILPSLRGREPEEASVLSKRSEMGKQRLQKLKQQADNPLVGNAPTSEEISVIRQFNKYTEIMKQQLGINNQDQALDAALKASDVLQNALEGKFNPKFKEKVQSQLTQLENKLKELFPGVF